MADREKLKADENKLFILNRDGWKCQGILNKKTNPTPCLKPLTWSTCHMAHRIGKGKVNRGKYGSKIINHHLNIKATCNNRDCNDSVSLGACQAEIDRLVDEILEALAW